MHPLVSPGVKVVGSFQELVSSPFAHGINALCWRRTLRGDFGEVVRLLGVQDGIETLDEDRLRRLAPAMRDRSAIEVMLEDLRLLQELGRDPALNCIGGYPRDDAAGTVATDVFSFHADSAPVETDTWLCTYHGSPSEALPNEETVRKIDDPLIRAALRHEFGGEDGDDFRAWLSENCYDLHYAPLPNARPWSFGLHHLWRIAVDWPGSQVPPCVHRAPSTIPGEPRLLLIS